MKKIILLSSILQFLFFISYAQPGSLDHSFGIDGKVTTNIGSGGNYGYSVALQSDGKIVLAGYTNDSTEDFALVRYNSNGSLDNTFGTNGKVITDFGSGNDEGKSVIIQSDGKIVVAGGSFNGTDWDIALARYNGDGSLDNTFDSDGKVTTPIGNYDDYAQSIALQSDGKFVVAGYSIIGTNYDFAVVRYKNDGSLDTDFGSGGKVTTSFGNNGDVGYSMVIQSDDKIVVAGYSTVGSNANFALARYNANGGLDTTFSSNGKVTTPIGNISDKAYSMAIQSDGKIVLGGMSYNGSDDDFALVRYNNDGTLDNTFDADGKVTTAIGNSNDGGSSVAIQADGKIVLAGQSYNGSNYDFAIIRYNSDGGLDNTFDFDGKVTTDFASTSDAVYSLAIQNDDKIVMAGVDWTGSNIDIAVARYNNVMTEIEETDSDSKVLLVEISPNPTKGKIQMIRNLHPPACGDGSVIDIKIYNVSGEKIYTTTLTSKPETIDLSSQPKGIYFVETILGNERSCKKLIIE